MRAIFRPNATGAWTNSVGSKVGRGILRSLFKVSGIAAIVLSATICPAQAETITVGGTAIDAPKGCLLTETLRNDSTIKRCTLARPDGSALLVTLDSRPGASSGGYDAGTESMLPFILHLDFQDFVAGVVRGASSHEVKAADLPKARVPKGMSVCKVYSIDMQGKGRVVRNRGHFCYGWGRKRDALTLTIGVVADVYSPSKGQGPAPDFEAQAKRILASLRTR